MVSLWTRELRQGFHEAVEDLHAITANPSEERDYRDSLPDIPSTHYALRLRDELQLADHIAFLAHSQEGVHAISAACVEESDTGLVIRLASNSTPSTLAVTGLTKILNTFSNCARQGTPGGRLEALVFEDVLELCQDRILQRIRPPWVETPLYYRGGEEPLWVRIERILTRIPSSSGPTPYDDIVTHLRAFTSSARELESPMSGARLRNAIKTIVRRCADISHSGENRSLEQQITLRGGSDLLTKEILQIDKLARYFNLCRDFGKLSQRCNFRNTTKVITLQYLEALQAEKPNGASKTCHVHAEVQLILYYEQFPTNRPPRAIGCSKSACFLCDILIQKLQKYCISHSHKRLYNQWTIMDVRWMTEEQVLYFREILQTIVRELSLLAKDLRTVTRVQRQFKSFGPESRAVLPLSSDSSLQGPLGELIARSESSTARKSDSTITKMKQTAVQVKIASRSQKEAASATSSSFTPSLIGPAVVPSRPNRPAILDLSKHDLPHHQKLSSNAEICLDLGKLLLIFDCSAISAGTLFIREVEADGIRAGKDEVRRIKADNIPSHEELHLHCGSSSTMIFQLYSGYSEVEVEIIWH